MRCGGSQRATWRGESVAVVLLQPTEYGIQVSIRLYLPIDLADFHEPLAVGLDPVGLESAVGTTGVHPTFACQIIGNPICSCSTLTIKARHLATRYTALRLCLIAVNLHTNCAVS